MQNDANESQRENLSGKKTTSSPLTNVEKYQIRLFILFGSGFCLVGAVCVVAISSPWGLASSVIEPIIAILAGTLISIVIKKFSESIAQQRGIQLPVCGCALNIVMISTSVLLVAYPDLFQARCIIMACGGGCCAVLSAYWFPCVCSEPEDANVLQFISRFALLGFAVALFLVFFLPYYLPIFASCSFLISLVCGFCAFNKYEKRIAYEGIPEYNPDRKPRIDIRSRIMLALNYFQIGICCGTIETLPEMLVTLTALAFGGAILYFDQKNKRLITENSLSPVSHSLPVVGLIFLCSDIIWLRLIAIFLLASTFAVIFSIGLSAISEHCRICKLDTIPVIAQANAIDFGALGLGVVAGFLIAVFGLFQSPTHLAALVFGSAYCIIASFVGKDRYPDESILIMGVDPRKLEKSTLQQKCRVLSERYELSPRQLEVLELLAVGRNARFIAERLTISQSTAQSHIRAIYTKLNVHSHQEVVDKVIETHLSSED